MAMKCFEKLVMAHTNTIIPDIMVPLKCASHPNKSTDYAISIALHSTLTPLFIDYSSAFKTIIHSKLITKLRTLGLKMSLGNRILDFLMGHTQVVRVGNNTSATLTINIGAPQGCVLSPLLYTLLTHF